jgi:hypothetical protein
MPTWMVWVFALAIPIDTLIIGWIVHLIQTGAA